MKTLLAKIWFCLLVIMLAVAMCATLINRIGVLGTIIFASVMLLTALAGYQLVRDCSL